MSTNNGSGGDAAGEPPPSKAPGRMSLAGKSLREKELVELREKGLAKNQRDKYSDYSTPLTTPEEAAAYLASMRAAASKTQKPTPPTNLNSADLDSWFMQQKARDNDMKRKQKEAEAILRGYRMSHTAPTGAVGNAPVVAKVAPPQSKPPSSDGRHQPRRVSGSVDAKSKVYSASTAAPSVLPSGPSRRRSSKIGKVEAAAAAEGSDAVSASRSDEEEAKPSTLGVAGTETEPVGEATQTSEGELDAAAVDTDESEGNGKGEEEGPIAVAETAKIVNNEGADTAGNEIKNSPDTAENEKGEEESTSALEENENGTKGEDAVEDNLKNESDEDTSETVDNEKEKEEQAVKDDDPQNKNAGGGSETAESVENAENENAPETEASEENKETHNAPEEAGGERGLPEMSEDRTEEEGENVEAASKVEEEEAAAVEPEALPEKDLEEKDGQEPLARDTAEEEPEEEPSTPLQPEKAEEDKVDDEKPIGAGEAKESDDPDDGKDAEKDIPDEPPLGTKKEEQEEVDADGNENQPQEDEEQGGELAADFGDAPEDEIREQGNVPVALGEDEAGSHNVSENEDEKKTDDEVELKPEQPKSEESWRNFISREEGAKFPPEAGRYHLYGSFACPWAHRTMLVLSMKGLEDAISVTAVHPTWKKTKPQDPSDEHRGWVFGNPEGEPFANTAGLGGPFPPAHPGNDPDPIFGCYSVRELYEHANDTEGKYTVPVLWDKKLNTIVSNESSDIIRMLNSEFNDFAKNPDLDLYPEGEREKIDEVNDWVYPTLNNGVYRCGFSTSQSAYNAALEELNESFDRVTEILQSQKFIAGDKVTEADIRLFVTLLRFDEVYAVYFKTNTRSVMMNPTLLNYCREIYQIDGVAETCRMDQIKAHYFCSHAELNKFSIIPGGPGFIKLLSEPHNRDD